MKKLNCLVLAFLCTVVCHAQVTDQQVKDALALKGIQASELHYVISSQHTATHNGITHVYLRQTFNGTEIFNATSSLHFNKEGKVVGFNNGFIKNAAAIAVPATGRLSYTNAVERVADALEMKVNTALARKPSELSEYVITDRQASSEDIKAKFYYLYREGKLIPIWNIQVLHDKTGNWWNKRVDANTGLIVDENNWTTHCHASLVKSNSARDDDDYYAFVFEDEVLLKKAPAASYRVYPFPYENPLKTGHLLMAVDSTKASPFGWHNVNGIAGADYTTTRGNNVWAKEDTLSQDSSNGYAPDGGSSLVFDYAMDQAAAPRNYLNAAITNLFYWNNTIHDILDRYGFDEAAGNFQQKNYSGLGEGSDYVFADAQDGSGTNNANFFTPPEGSNPRMQMFLWKQSTAGAFNITTPVSVKGQYISAIASFGTFPSPPGVQGNLQLADDGSANPTWACNTLQNNLTGKIALIDRGDCFFVDKVLHAQQAGAVGAVVINNTPGAPFSMGTGGDNTSLVHIPSIMISQALGATLKGLLALDSVVHVILVDSAGQSKFYDSDFDNGIIIHEYGHGVSNRLTGGAQNADCLFNAEQGGEGWSDFFALAFTAQPYHNPEAGRGMCVYVVGEDTNDVGIRDYRYSRNMSIDPVTYDYIKTNTEAHYVGFVWCSVLYDIFWDMVNKYGFSTDIYAGNAGNNKAIQLVIDGLKLQPCSPGFVDARDAILLADSINNGFANYDLLWKAFARRGLGFYADQGLSLDATDGTQSFALPPEKPNGVHEVNGSNDFSMYPNPSTGMITITVNVDPVLQVRVYDITGKLVYSKSAQGINANLDLRGNDPGIYIVQVTGINGTTCKKLVLD